MDNINNENNEVEKSITTNFITAVLDIAFADLAHGKTVRDKSLTISKELKNDSDENNINIHEVKDILLSINELIKSYQSARDKLNKVVLTLEANKSKN